MPSITYTAYIMDHISDQHTALLSSSGRFQIQSRILVVDSSASARAMICGAFENNATMIQCVACTSAEEALKKLQQEKFDLVTTSLMLPDMDGLELCRNIRAHKSTQLIPVIVISGDADERLRIEGFSSGVTDYFNKSHGHTELVDFISSYLERTFGIAPKVMLVEDSPTVAALLKKTLLQQGMQVTHFVEAEHALEALSPDDNVLHENEEFDVVLTDFKLAGNMTGGDLLHAIRTQLARGSQELPVLIMTGNDDVKQQVDLFNAGANDFITKPAIEQVLVARIRSQVLIRQQYLTLQRQKQRMEILSLTDNLTGAFNRRYLTKHGFELARNPLQIPLCVMIMDIDHFKTVNDTYGHLNGDKVLIQVAESIRNLLPEDSVTIRYGGEEFCVLVPRCDRDKALQLAEQIRLAVAGTHVDEIQVTLSIGLCIIPQASSDHLNDCLSNADIALYSAKKKGRNRVECFTQ